MSKVSISILSPRSKKRFVTDTVALISYFSSVFGQDSEISPRAISLIDSAFQYEDEVILSIPGVVFVEIFEKWFRGDESQDEEFRAKFKFEVFERVRRAPNIEIREIDDEVLEMFLSLQDPDINLENSDQLILASAAVLESPLITSDGNLIQYVKKHQVIPYTIS
jgi:predicted nucleic acid-binding protein